MRFVDVENHRGMTPGSARIITFVMPGLTRLSRKGLSLCQHRSQTLQMLLYNGNPNQPVLPGSRPEARGEATAPAQLSIAVFATDLSGDFTACNPAFTQLCGYSPKELLGRNFAALFAREEKAGREEQVRLQRTILEAAGSGEYQAELVAYRKSGAAVPVQFSATLLRDVDSRPLSIVAFVAPLAEDAGVKTESTLPPGIVSRKIDGTDFILASPVMHKFMGLVDRVASHTETVLITGETGTGKEMIARTVHESSERRSRPWVDINCAALPENLVESELFGYEKGAFSSADSAKPGLFELADKGTLFLDEIGELPLQMQVKLLRVLDGHTFYRLGGHRKIKVDVRIVAATNQDLEAAVHAGRFRQDLFHRLSQFRLSVPPLRERPEDVVALAEHFLRLKAPNKHFSPQAISALLSHSWPGNIRELRNLVAKVSMESSGHEIDFSRISAALTGEKSAMRQTASMPVGNLESMEEQMILKALERTGGHRTQAAEHLGISRRTLSRKLKEYNITFEPGETAPSMGFISTEQQKFFRARVQIPVTLINARGEQIEVQGVNLSTGGMGLDGLKEPLRFSGMIDVKFALPESDILFQAKARMMWVGDEGRIGIRFAVIEPALFEHLQRWTNNKMKEEGWDFPG